MGTTFKKHYVCSNMSTSSRSVLYTGTHITGTKMLDNTDYDWQGALSEDITTIADRMNQAGYYNAYKGKWHMAKSGILESVIAADKETDEDGNTTVDMDNRRFVGAIVTERYKFARYFSPLNFNTPQTFEELIANNDIELYDLENNTDATNNLAADPEANKELIMEMNEKLNDLIAQESGVDDGSEFQETLAAYKQAQQSGDSE